MDKRVVCFGFLCRKPRWAPTWRGWLFLAVISALIGALFILGVHRFLAVSHPLRGGILVLEGWLNDDAMKDAIAEFRGHGYDRVVVTGGPLERGSFLTPYGSYAALGAATLIQLGIDTNLLVVLPAPPVKKDRTYASAMALSEWMKMQNPPIRKINLLTQGAHARRSWLLFQKAVGTVADVGVIAIEDRDFDPKRWFASSMGVRFVFSEFIAYAYAKFFFIVDD